MLMCDELCKQNVVGQLGIINTKLDTLIENQRDQELRIRQQEQKKCPKHRDIACDIQNLKTDMAVGKMKLVMIVSCMTVLGTWLLNLIGGYL